MESIFRIIFWAGLAGCVGWFWYAVFGTVTPLVEAVGVCSGVLVLIGAAGLLFFWIPQAFDLGKANKVADTAAQHAVAGADAAKSKVSGKLELWHWWAALGVAAVFVTGWYMMTAAEQAKADRAAFTSQIRSRCASWMNKEFNNNSRSNPTRVYGDWQKNEHIVVEIIWNRGHSGGSLDSRLCVYNPKTGRMHSPGAFDRGRWEKY